MRLFGSLPLIGGVRVGAVSDRIDWRTPDAQAFVRQGMYVLAIGAGVVALGAAAFLFLLIKDVLMAG